MTIHRLPISDIEKTMRYGTVSHASHLFFRIKKNTTKPPKNRFAFVVSTKVDKRAVIRNSIRRKLKEGVRVLFKNSAHGFDIVYIARASAVGASYRELTHDLETLNKKSQLFKSV